MPFQTVRLRPGVQVEATPSLNEAGYSESNLIRWRNGLAEKIGGWTKYYAFVISGVIRALHAWQDLNGNDRLAVGSTTNLSVITDGNLQDLTPQIFQSDNDPNISTTSASTTVVLVDDNIANVTVFDSIEFKTPVSVGGIILSGVYAIDLVLGTTSYQITAASAATATRAPADITDITMANPGVVTYSGDDNFADGDLVYIYGVAGMTEVNGTLQTVANVDTGANTFEIENTSGFTAYTSGGTASPAAVPLFTTSSGSSSVTVTFQSHGLSVGDTINFPLSTTLGGVTITGTYSVFSVTDVDNFIINADAEASSSASAFMNDGDVRIDYYITLGPLGASTGYGIGTYGTGAYGIGSTPSAQQSGTPITTTNWSLDNWGDILLANPKGGGIYWWQSTTGYQNANLVPQAPIFNNGMFVAMQARILVAWGSTTIDRTIGVDQDPLLIRWSDQENFFNWEITATTAAGSDRIPTGSMIVGALPAQNYNYFWTDLDLWAQDYVSGGLVFTLNRVASNCGLIAQHARAQLAGNIYWMGEKNFFAKMSGGVAPIPCTVWDYCFQNLDDTNKTKSVAGANTAFNEVVFFFPSASGGTGECDKYVKFNTLENTWDYGNIGRTAWIDQSVLGTPIGSSPGGLIFSHESGYNADNGPISASFETGYWVLSEGEEFAFVDFVIPDFKYGTIAGAQNVEISVTLLAADYPGDAPREYGPYTVTSATQFINCRLRGRLMAFRVETNDEDSFWRIGAIRFRYAIDGRR